MVTNEKMVCGSGLRLGGPYRLASKCLGYGYEAPAYRQAGVSVAGYGYV